MKYQIVEKKKMTLLALVREFSNEIMDDNDNRDISKFWDEMIANGETKRLLECTDSMDMYGTCAPTEEDNGTFKYGICVLYDGKEVPEGFQKWIIEPSLWAVFDCKTQSDIAITWDKIFKEFLPQSGYEMLHQPDLEYYGADNDENFCQIWLPVKQK